MHTLRYDAGAGAYDRLTGRWSRMYVDRVLDAARVQPGMRVLDVATGTGDAAIVAADRVGDGGLVVATDISVPMLREAETKARSRHIRFIHADGAALSSSEGCFDAVICLFGLMFFADKRETLKGVRRLLRPGGRLVTTSWGTSAQAPFGGLLAEALATQLPEDRDDLLRPFSLSDPDELTRLFQSAGFDDVVIERETRSSPFASFDSDFWEPIEAGGGRLGQAYLGLSLHARAEVRAQVLGQLPPEAHDGPFVLPHSALLATGTNNL